jgi:hypothetical protein
MGWSNGWDNSYAAYGPFTTAAIITYTNTSPQAQLIHDITMPMGTGLGTYTAGITATGDGSPVTFYVTGGGVESTHVLVSNQVGVTGSPSYPPRGEMVNHTVVFNTPVTVATGATVSFLFSSNATQQGTSQVFVWDNELISGTVTDVLTGVVHLHQGGSWSSLLPIHVHTGGSWSDTGTLHHLTNGSWD